VRYAWKRGMLQALAETSDQGASVETLAETGRWSVYALKVVLETCLSAGVVQRRDGCYLLDKAGYCLLSDRLTQVNLDFMHDVCYRGLAELEASLDQQTPLGLRALGPWASLYEGMAELPEPAKTSWFEFDHLYSDTSFPAVLPDLLATAPRRVMDVGANTGKFARLALQSSPDIELHLVDLPQQLAVARGTLAEAGMLGRATLHARDLLAPDASLPPEMDVVWMSQFLSCFSEPVIARILKLAEQALAPRGQLLVLDTLWDSQRYDIATFCLINTSPYFTAMASGNSKIYESGDYLRLAEAAGLRLLARRDGIGYGHSLLRFTRA
jgi:SAM-dependent methyltransferase